jgi:hypothetical protein
MQLIPNSGFAVYKGTWTRNPDDSIDIVSRLWASEGVARVIGEDIYQTHKDKLQISKVSRDRFANELVYHDTVFIPAPPIDGIEYMLSMQEDPQD